MLKHIITLIFIFTTFITNAQTITGKKIRSFYIGDPTDSMFSRLSPPAKSFLDSFFNKNNIDTSSTYVIKYEDVFTKYTTLKYLSTHTYKYARWSRIGNSTNITEAQSKDISNIKPNKLIVLYSTDFLDLEILVMYYMD